MLTHTLTTGANDGRPIHMLYTFSDGEAYTIRARRNGWHSWTQQVYKTVNGRHSPSTMAELDAKAATSTLTHRTEA